ncbi:MATE family efflux transporter [Humisphaera borealis]|uniref:Multidrug-efflux transporter n=1 Tax=Humisphaera borealis TaxID=2807512 RepID=A0A7M2WSQ0_9BACT|nr:MATE family efflux transporter [Humisphaera borealis]QOV88463.1 MATE family efflux transporter [Humisphaera borealis]
MTRATAGTDSAPDTVLPETFASRKVDGLSTASPSSGPLSNQENGVLRPLVLLSLPILAENILHMLVGLTDTYLAGHLETEASAATAAVGTVAYILWFVNLIAMAIATGATAIVSRAVGARHRSLASSVTGQSVTASLLLGTIAAILFAIFAGPLSDLTQLKGMAHDYSRYYFQILSISLPFSLVTVAAGAVLRGAGDTLSPAIAMVVVDLVNIFLSLVLSRGYLGFPELGFKGIAIGTVVAYVIGGVILLAVLARGTRVRLYRHRLRPHWSTLRRLIRIGLPNGVEGGLTWSANFVVLRTINQFDATNVSAAAHIVTIRVESLSFMIGLAIATATATLVGQSLGQKNPARAVRVTWTAAWLAIAVMVCWAFGFFFAGRHLAMLMTSDPAAVDLAARCLAITAFSQVGFAATLVFAGALRGAGDTVAVMLINIVSQLGLRLIGVLVLVKGFHYGLEAVWVVLAIELTLRGAAITGRFIHGGWKHVKV